MQTIEPGLPSQSSEKGATSQQGPQGRGGVQPGCATSKDCGKTESRASRPTAYASFRHTACAWGEEEALGSGSGRPEGPPPWQLSCFRPG